MLKIDENGVVDNAFSLQTLNGDGIIDIVKQSDGKFVIATTQQPNLVARYNGDGSYDNSF
jgi:hypothetical protein